MNTVLKIICNRFIELDKNRQNKLLNTENVIGNKGISEEEENIIKFIDMILDAGLKVGIKEVLLWDLLDEILDSKSNNYFKI